MREDEDAFGEQLEEVTSARRCRGVPLDVGGLAKTTVTGVFIVAAAAVDKQSGPPR